MSWIGWYVPIRFISSSHHSSDLSTSFFRLWSWRDQMQFSVDYNTAIVSTEAVKLLIDKWIRCVAFIILIIIINDRMFISKGIHLFVSMSHGKQTGHVAR
jgi:hypothetical protein